MTMTTSRFAFAACALAGLCAADASAQSRGVYWRLDTGYAWAADANLKDKNPGSVAGTYICGGPLLSGACNDPPGELNDIGQAWIVGVGVGYRFGPRFRADATLGYRSGFKLDDVDKAPSSYTAHITSYNVMVNGYVDFPLQRSTRLVPYVGAGVGYASNKIDDITNPNLPPLPPGVSTLPGGTKGDVAWQLSLGVGIEVTGKLTLDIGYRYLDSGKLETSSGNVTGFFAGPYNGATGKLRSHELQVGIRF
jgi:opacity protein-like surface antigen